MNDDGPLTREQIDQLLVDCHSHELPPEIFTLLQRAARLGMELNRPNLLTEEQLTGLPDLDTVAERGTHEMLQRAYQRAASLGARMVLNISIRKVFALGGGHYFVCSLCNSVRVGDPSEIEHTDQCAWIRERLCE